jgi:PAS domain S-box-containing protein
MSEYTRSKSSTFQGQGEYNVTIRHKLGNVLFISLLMGTFAIFYIRENSRSEGITHHEVLRDVVEAGIESRIVADKTGKILICSPTAAKICGYTSADLEGRKAVELVPAEMKAQHLKSFTRAMENEAAIDKVHITRCYLLKKDGTKVYVEVIIRVVENVDMGRLAVVTITPVDEIKFTPAPEEITPLTGQTVRRASAVSWITERNARSH